MDRIRHGGNVYAHPDCIDFSASLSPLGLPQGVREALVDHLEFWDASARMAYKYV